MAGDTKITVVVVSFVIDLLACVYICTIMTEQIRQKTLTLCWVWKYELLRELAMVSEGTVLNIRVDCRSVRIISAPVEEQQVIWPADNANVYF